MEKIELREYDLIGILNDEEDCLERFKEYEGNTYVCDAITQIADNAIPIYYNEIWEHARDISEFIEEAKAQGLCEGNISLEQMFQMGYYEYYIQSLYNNLDTMVFNMIAEQVNDFLEDFHSDIEIDLCEIEEKIEEASHDFDNNKRMSRIIDEAKDIISDIEDGEFNLE